jgi:serine/threonine protein kinase
VALKFIWLTNGRAGREFRALEFVRNLRHPHLLDVQFVILRPGYLVLAMPLCDQSLKDRLRVCRNQGRSGLPADELLAYMRDLAGAIDYLNEPRHLVGNGRLAGIQHRDIKPENIMLAGGAVRLADFGLAKPMESSSATHSGCMSPHYVAPEELGGEVSRYSDQYSLAVTETRSTAPPPSSARRMPTSATQSR